MSLEIDARALRLVREILIEFLPDGEVWAFGSRVAGAAKPFSDLDLVIVAPSPIPVRRLALLASAFEESDLPIKVDIAELGSLSPTLRADIEAHHEVILPVSPDTRERRGLTRLPAR